MQIKITVSAYYHIPVNNFNALWSDGDSDLFRRTRDGSAATHLCEEE